MKRGSEKNGTKKLKRLFFPFFLHERMEKFSTEGVTTMVDLLRAVM
jgi:hypothetical protein